MSENHCKELEQSAQIMGEIENPSISEFELTAESFFEVAKCYDQIADRINASKNYALAGEFYLVADQSNRAAECFGKSVLRSLMADDLESARIMLDKGKEFGELAETFHFRLASDTFSQRITDEFDSLYNEAYYGFNEEEEEVSDMDLYDHISSPLIDDQELEELLVEQDIGSSDFLPNDITQIGGKTKAYQLNTDIDSSKRDRLIDSLILSVKRGTYLDISSNVSAKNSHGNQATVAKQNHFMTLDQYQSNINELSEKNFIEEDLEDIFLDDKANLPQNSLNSQEHSLKNQELVNNQIENKKGTKKIPMSHLGPQQEISTDKKNKKYSSLLIEEIDSVPDLITQVSDFISYSEISNPELEDINDIIIQDSIPLNWKIKGIKASKDVVLVSQEVDSETGSLVFKWKRNKLRSGEKANIQYILSKRIQRNIITIIKNQVSLLTNYFDIEKDGKLGLVAEIPFQIQTNELIDFLLIEDIIPPELKVSGIIPSDFGFQKFHTKEGLLFRWVLTGINSNTIPLIQYQLIERPLTVSITHEFKFKEYPDASLTLIKIVEPLIDALDHEYLLYYELRAKNLPKLTIDIKDSLYPKNIEVKLLGSHPSWMRPTIKTNNSSGKQYEFTRIELERNKTRKFIIRIKGDQPIKPVNPTTLIKKENQLAVSSHCQISEEVSSTESVDLRKKMGKSFIKS